MSRGYSVTSPWGLSQNYEYIWGKVTVQSLFRVTNEMPQKVQGRVLKIILRLRELVTVISKQKVIVPEQKLKALLS